VTGLHDEAIKHPMNVATRCSATLLILVSCLAACGEQPPPPKAPAPKPVAPAPAPEPPPPKCEGLKESCTANAETRARIPGVGYAFVPPEGWNYAFLEEATVAQVGDKGAVMALTSYPREKNGQATAKRRGDLVKSLTELVLIQPPKGVPLSRPDQETDIAGMKMALWERKGATRSKDNGALLILSSAMGDRELFGVGFASKEDTAGTEAILKALQTIAPDADAAKAAEERRAREQSEPPKDK
jgi:hypothetical protein